MHQVKGVYPSQEAFDRMMVMLDTTFGQPGVKAWWLERGAEISAPHVAERMASTSNG